MDSKKAMQGHTISSPDIIHLNVGGRRFSTSKQTLLWHQNSFFSSLVSGRIPSMKDENGAYFIDRDPDLFGVILNYLRTNDLNVNGVDIAAIRHEAEYYGLLSLVRKLALCEDHFYGSCGDVLFHGFIPPPETQSASDLVDHSRSSSNSTDTSSNSQSSSTSGSASQNGSGMPSPSPSLRPNTDNLQRLRDSVGPEGEPGQRRSMTDNDPGLRRLAADTEAAQRGTNASTVGHRLAGGGVQEFTFQHRRFPVAGQLPQPSTSQTPPQTTQQQDYQPLSYHQNDPESRTHTPIPGDSQTRKVNLIRCHQNWLAAAYPNHVALFKVKDMVGWQEVWLSPSFASSGGVSRMAINAKTSSPGGGAAVGQGAAGGGNAAAVTAGVDQGGCMLAVGGGTTITLLRVKPRSGGPEAGAANTPPNSRQMGQFQLGGRSIDDLFFIGSQLVALSRTGRVGVWHSMTHNWQIQDVAPIHSYDIARSEFLLLGCENGCIYFIDMQKFPLRIVDNDLLVTKLYSDPKGDAVTALSVYVTPRTSMSGGNWIEIAYGTSSGCVRVIVQHPETVGQCPQLFQTFTVHRAKVTNVVLSEKHLISVCAEMNHVRTWSVTRFRGMISTQPGSTPLASFHVISMHPPFSTSADPLPQSASHAAPSTQSPLSSSNGGGPREDVTKTGLYEAGNHPGPYGEKDEQLLFIQKVLPDADQVFVRLASNGKRVCVIRSVNGSPVSSFCVHECDGSSRVVAHPRRYLFTGHLDGTVEIWDLTTALDNATSATGEHTGTANTNTAECQSGGPTARELIRLMDSCDLISSSRTCTPVNLSPSPSAYWGASCVPLTAQRSTAGHHLPGQHSSQWSLASSTLGANQNRD